MPRHLRDLVAATLAEELDASLDVRLPLGPRNVWMEEPGPVRVRVEITPVPAAPAPELGARPEEKRAPAAGKGKGG